MIIVTYKGQKLRYIAEFHGKEVLWILNPNQINMQGMTFVGGYPDEYCNIVKQVDTISFITKPGRQTIAA